MSISTTENIVIGFQDFWSRKIRSFITILGIVLGTLSIIVVLALIKGINSMTLEWMMERGGIRKISVNRNWEYQSKKYGRKTLSLDEFEKIQALIPEAESFNPKVRRYFKLSYGNKDYWGPVFGVLPDFADVEEWKQDKGRFITNYDTSSSNDVIVLGSNVVEELFGNKDPIGKTITVQNRRLKVIGTMEHRHFENRQNIGNNNNALAYLNQRSFIPLHTLIHKYINEDVIWGFDLKAKTIDDVEIIKDKLHNILMNIRQREPIFRIETAQDSIDEAKKSSQIFMVIFILISGISLFVGGIVIMNIMLATIQERTREIGIRLAVGARRRDIFSQFLVQSVLTTTIGGIIGIIIGFTILSTVENYLNMPLEASTSMVVIAIGVSAGIGLIFGIIPAVRASNLDPVKALRYE